MFQAFLAIVEVLPYVLTSYVQICIGYDTLIISLKTSGFHVCMISLKSSILILTTFISSLCQFRDIVNVVDAIFTQFALPAFYKVRINYKP